MKFASAVLVFGFGALLASAALAADRRSGTWLRPEVRVELGPNEFVLAGADREGLVERVHLAAERAARAEFVLETPEGVRVGTRRDFGLEVDEANTALELAQAVQRALAEGKASSRVSRLVSGRLPTVTVPLRLRFDEGKAREELVQMARAIDRVPEDAVLHLDEHRIESAVDGRRLRIESTLLRLARANAEGSVFVESDVETIPPDVLDQDVAPVDVSLVLAAYETSFRNKAGSRKVNITMAARYLDGVVLPPGEVLSFNHRVGRRLHGRGFVDAPVILNDELEQDVGGGVCQVATTLHAAAIHGGLEVVERRSHSRPSGYAPLGLDATVIDGKVDLKLRNPYDTPILVHAFLSGPFTIRVELLGRAPSAKIEHAYAVQKSEAFARRVWVKEELAEGTFERKQKGSHGMDVTSVVKTTYPDGRVESRRYPSKYYPVPEVFWVGRGLGPSALPPLPEGAQALVFQGEPVPLETLGE